MINFLRRLLGYGDEPKWVYLEQQRRARELADQQQTIFALWDADAIREDIHHELEPLQVLPPKRKAHTRKNRVQRQTT